MTGEVGMATLETGADIRPFQLDVSDEALEDLRRRIQATRLPSSGPDMSSPSARSLSLAFPSGCLTEVMCREGDRQKEGDHGGTAHHRDVCARKA